MFLQNLLLKKIFFSLTLVITSSTASAYQKIDSTIAVVGDDVIFQSELEKKSKQLLFTLNRKNLNSSENSIKKKALESLILEKIQLSIAKKANASVTEQELNRAIAITQRNMQRQGLSLPKFLKSQELTQEEFVQQLKNEILIDKVQNAAVNQRISITEKEIDNFLNSKEGKDWISPKFHIGHIFLPATSKNKKSKKQQAVKLHKQLTQKNSNFEEIAKKFSKGPNAQKGGNMGVVKKEDLPDLFANQVSPLKSGDITLPFESDAGIHILKVFNRAGAQPVVVTQYETRHILVKTTELFTEEEAKDKIQNLYNRILSGENFNEMAQEFSDDLGSKSDGGYLDWSIPGKFVPEFEATMQATPKGKVSPPFKSPFGWHIMKVEDIRTRDIFDDVKGKQAANFLRRQRFQDELNIWLQELREGTYVETLI